MVKINRPKLNNLTIEKILENKVILACILVCLLVSGISLFILDELVSLTVFRLLVYVMLLFTLKLLIFFIIDIF